MLCRKRNKMSFTQMLIKKSFSELPVYFRPYLTSSVYPFLIVDCVVWNLSIVKVCGVY